MGCLALRLGEGKVRGVVGAHVMKTAWLAYGVRQSGLDWAGWERLGAAGSVWLHVHAVQRTNS